MIILDDMAGPNININFGPPRRRRRRRAFGAGGGLIAVIILAMLGYSKLNKPAAPVAPPARLPAAAAALEKLRSRDVGKNLQQIPATVVDKGPLRHVPYLSYSAGDVEFNVYGDPDAPACLEIGTSSGDSARRSACHDALAALLPDLEGRFVFSTAPGKQTREGLTFEITPETAPDAYGRWWVSVYDATLLDGSRASAAELGSVAGPRPAGDEAARSRPGGKVYVKGYYRKDGTYVPAHEKK